MKKIFTVLAITFAILFVWQANALSQTPAGSDFYYVGDTNECKVIDYMCEDGWEGFSDNSWCGCKKIQDPDIVCTMEYAPVCGQPNQSCPEWAACEYTPPFTYGNKCELEADGARFLYEWECEQDTPKPEPRVCPEYWAPVCGKTQAKACLSLDCAQHFQTYSNISCLEADDAEFQYEGECKDVEPPKPPLPEPTKTKYYVWDTNKCQIIKYRCEDGWKGFTDSVGCGCEKNKSTLSDEIKNRIDDIVATFIDKLESKGYSSSKMYDVITVMIVKIQLLKAEKPQYSEILNYTIKVLVQYSEEYKEDDLNIIKKIFQGF